MKRVMKRVVLVLTVITFVFIAIAWWAAKEAKAQLASMVYHDVDMGTVVDGTHYGETDALLVFVQVAVQIKEHVIQDIRIIEHRNGLGGSAESIVNAIIEENDYDVDAIGGATLSSEAIKSAVSKALKIGQKE